MEKVGIFFGHLDYTTAIWYIFRPFQFGIFWYTVSRKIWQPCIAAQKFGPCPMLPFRERRSGVDVIDHNFRRFLPIFGEKMAFFLKIQCYDQFFQNLSLFRVKNANFFAKILAKIFKKS
jgi:hypothetical protein